MTISRADIPTLPPPAGVVGAPALGSTSHFKLKSAFEYRFWRQGKPIDLKKGEIFTTNNKNDQEYFRARPDVIGECNAAGEFIGDARPGQVDARKAKSFQRYGKGPGPSNPTIPAPPSAVAIGKPPSPSPVLPRAYSPSQDETPSIQKATPLAGTNEGVRTTGPAVPPPPPPMDRKARKDKVSKLVEQQKAEQAAVPMSPIETAGADGTIVAKAEVRR